MKGREPMFETKKKRKRIEELDNKINQLQADIDKKRYELDKATSRLRAKLQEVEDMADEANKKKLELGLIDGIVEMQELGMEYIPAKDCLSDIEQKINEVDDKIADMIGNKQVAVTNRVYMIDRSATKGARFQQTFCNNLVMGFNCYYEKKAKAVTTANYAKTVELLDKKFVAMNKQGSLLGINMSKKYLDLCIERLALSLDMKNAKEQEKAAIREERKKMREQEQLLADAERERKRLKAEKEALDIAFAKALSEAEREKIKAEMTDLDKRLTDIDWRIEHPKSGWVYLITSPSLPGMYKCGVSRRLSGPQERVRELSSSALPFPYCLKAYCFSDDAFEVESSMHNFFDQNRVSPNREFFYGDVKTAIEALRDVFGQDVHYGTYDELEEE